MSVKIKEILVKDIELDELFQNQYLNRWNYDKSDIELLESIHIVGMILPIIVRTNGNKYLLIEGYRRLKTKQILGHETIICKILKLSDSDAIGLYLSSHLGCKELTYEQKKCSIKTFRGIMKDLDKKDLTKKNKVKELEEYVNDLETRNKLPKQIISSYYCSICEHKHVRGQKYEDHKKYAEVK